MEVDKHVIMKKRKFTTEFKTKVVLEALQERETIKEIAKKYDIHPNQISTWKRQFISNVEHIFEKDTSKADDEKEMAKLHKELRQLQMENDFLKKALGK